MTTLTVWDGATEQPATLTLWDGTAEQPVSAAEILPYGAPSVTEILTRAGFTIAHRCGSADWAEASMRGATESALRRADALEVPLSRTSDGVWFGLHDQTLLRTSGVDIDPTTLTWSELQAYTIAAPAGGDSRFGAQPYAQMTDILEAYGSSHVILLDPKYHGNQTYRGELLDLVEATIPDPQQRIVIKYFGNNLTLADYVRSRGYTTWGYFYESDYLADPTGTMAQAAHWDWLGLNWDASASTWADFVGVGKPVIAHIAATTTQRQTALDAGADGVMCSGIRAIQGAPEI